MLLIEYGYYQSYNSFTFLPNKSGLDKNELILLLFLIQLNNVGTESLLIRYVLALFLQ